MNQERRGLANIRTQRNRKWVRSVYMESLVFVSGFEGGVYVLEDFVDHRLWVWVVRLLHGDLFFWFSAFIEQANGASRTRYSMNCSGWHFSGRKWGGQSERGNRLTDEFYLHSVHQSINVWARDKTWLISTGCFGIPDTKERLVTVWVVTLPTESDMRVHFYSIND